MRLLLFNLATDADDPILGFTTRWIRAIAERVEFVSVVTMRAGRLEVPENVRVYSIGKEKGYSEPRRLLEFYRHLWRILREDRIDACFSHMIPIFTVLAAPLLKAKGIPIVTWYAHPSITWTLRVAHVLSDRMVASVPGAYPYRHDKLMTTGQGIDVDLFALDAGVSLGKPPMILCAGRLSPSKNHPTLIKAASILRKRSRLQFRVVIVGGLATVKDKAYVRSLHQQVDELGLQETVAFEPAVSMETLPSWYRSCAAHVNLTPNGFGDKVALEAMACGRLCLVANQGFEETLGIYSDKCLYSYRDPEQLADRMEWAVSLSDDERMVIGTYLRRQVESMHGLDQLAQRLVDLFESTRGFPRVAQIKSPSKI